MKPSTAGRRLVLLSLPFLGFGLLWAVWPPMQHRLGEDVLALLRTLGVAMALIGLGAVSLGVYLLRRGDERVL